jgi:hypothetical protein
MADIIRIKRRTGGAPGSPATLANAELAYNEVDHTLYYGEGTGGAGGTATTVVPIGGQGLASSSLPIMDGTAAIGIGATWARNDHVHPSDTTRAPLASPTFTGVPAAPTAPNGTNTTQLATTAFVLATRIDQLVAPNTDVSWNAHKITGLQDPTGAQDAVTKNYADNLAQGLDTKGSVKAATTTNITLSGSPQTIDGVSCTTGDRVLVKDQTTTANNGLYVVAVGAWTRTTDMDSWAEVPSAYVFVEQGTTNADTGWTCTSDQGGTLNTTAITWAQFSGAGAGANAGAGLTKTGSTIDVVGAAGRILVNADNIDIDPAYVGQTSITTLGTIATGTWNGSTIQVNRGGSGATTLTGYLKGTGTTPFTAAATIPNTDITGLGTMAIQNASAVAITGGTIDGVTFDGGTF